jgi:hypothetical protein
MDTQIKLYLLSPEKLHKISRAARVFRCLCIQNRRRCPLRELQRFCGLVNSIKLASPGGTLSSELARLEIVGKPSGKAALGCAVWDSTPTASLVTDASMEGWGVVICTSLNDARTQPPVVLSVPPRGLFTPDHAEPRTINQREILAVILGLQSSLSVARVAHVQFVSPVQVTLAVTRNRRVDLRE